MSDNREKLVGLLGFYLRNAFIGAGLTWDSDNWAEVNEMVDLIVTIATDEAVTAVENLVPEEARQ